MAHLPHSPPNGPPGPPMTPALDLVMRCWPALAFGLLLGGSPGLGVWQTEQDSPPSFQLVHAAQLLRTTRHTQRGGEGHCPRTGS